LLGAVAYAYKSSTQEIEPGRFQVQGQPRLHSEILS
jgi:hypothetical protein